MARGSGSWRRIRRHLGPVECERAARPRRTSRREGSNTKGNSSETERVDASSVFAGGEETRRNRSEHRDSWGNFLSCASDQRTEMAPGKGGLRTERCFALFRRKSCTAAWRHPVGELPEPWQQHVILVRNESRAVVSRDPSRRSGERRFEVNKIKPRTSGWKKRTSKIGRAWWFDLARERNLIFVPCSAKTRCAQQQLLRNDNKRCMKETRIYESIDSFFFFYFYFPLRACLFFVCKIFPLFCSRYGIIVASLENFDTIRQFALQVMNFFFFFL